MSDQLLPYISNNLEIIKTSSLKTDLDDFGFRYGYGIFETILIENQVPFLFTAHLKRFRRSAAELKIPLHYTHHQIHLALQKLILKNKIKSAICNWYLTPGSLSDWQHGFDHPRLLMVVRKPENIKHSTPINLRVYQEKTPRTHWDSHKLMSRVSLINTRLGSPEDLLLVSPKNEILETTTANIFFIKEKTLITPRGIGILPGVMKAHVISNAKNEGIQIEHRRVELSEISTFDRIFLTNSIRKIIPIEKDSLIL